MLSAAPKPTPAPVPVPSSKPAPTSADPNALMNAWKKANPKVKAQNIKSRAFLGLSLLIVAVPVIVFFLLIEGVIPPTKGIKNGHLSSVEFLARYDECETLFNALIGVTAVLSLIAPICKIFCEYLPSIRCAAWLKKTGYDLKPYVADYKKNRMLGGRWTKSDQAAYYALSKGGKAAGIALCISEFFDFIPTTIFLAVILKKVCLSMMLSWQLNETAALNIPWGLVAAAIACIVVGAIIQITILIVGPRYLKNYPTEDDKQA